MTVDDWTRMKMKMSFMDESANAYAAKRRRIERLVQHKLVSQKHGKAPEATLKPNTEYWAADVTSTEGTKSCLMEIIPWYFGSLHPQLSGKPLGEYFRNRCVEVIKAICISFFSSCGSNLPEVRHHHYTAINMIDAGAMLFLMTQNGDWRRNCLKWYQRFLGLCLAIKFHRKADVCARVIVNRGAHISAPSPGNTLEAVRTSEMDFYSTLWCKVTTPDSYYYIDRVQKLGTNSGSTMTRASRLQNWWTGLFAE